MLFSSTIKVREVQYYLHDIDEVSTSLKYYGYMNEEGSWLIMKEALSGTLTEYRFARATYQVAGGYPEAWSNRTSLNYNFLYASY